MEMSKILPLFPSPFRALCPTLRPSAARAGAQLRSLRRDPFQRALRNQRGWGGGKEGRKNPSPRGPSPLSTSSFFAFSLAPLRFIAPLLLLALMETANTHTFRASEKA